MSKMADQSSAAARRQAQEAFVRKQDAERNDALARLRQVENAKTARLRALRLAKEAADKASAATSKPGARRPIGKRTARLLDR